MTNANAITNCLENLNIVLPDNLISSQLQTKNWRKSQEWYKGGKRNECEIYQRNKFEKIIGQKVHKTNLRLNTENYKLEEKTNPLTGKNGFEYTEDFDGDVKKNDIRYLINFKMICDSGGAQTRSLREVYHFIKCQLEYLLRNPDSNIKFVNIIEGDIGHKYTTKNHDEKREASLLDLLDKERYTSIKDKVFIGDLKTFSNQYQF